MQNYYRPSNYYPYAQQYYAAQNQYMTPLYFPNMLASEQMAPYQQQNMSNMLIPLEPYTYPQNLPEALKLIQEAVAGETEDKLFYQYLIDTAPSKEDKEIITSIRDDELNHFALFRQVYFLLTGNMLPPPEEVPFEKPKSYCEGLKRAIKGEQNAVRKYRKILFALQDRVQINILVEIITDELRHGTLYNYLYTKNGCRV